MIRSWILSTQMTKTFGGICDINIVQHNKLRASFYRYSNAVKNIAYFFVLLYAHVCIIIML